MRRRRRRARSGRGSLDQHAEDAAAARQVADRALRLLVDAGGEEALELLAALVEHADRGVARAGHLAGDLEQLMQLVRGCTLVNCHHSTSSWSIRASSASLIALFPLDQGDGYVGNLYREHRRCRGYPQAHRGRTAPGSWDPTALFAPR